MKRCAECGLSSRMTKLHPVEGYTRIADGKETQAYRCQNCEDTCSMCEKPKEGQDNPYYICQCHR